MQLLFDLVGKIWWKNWSILYCKTSLLPRSKLVCGEVLERICEPACSNRPNYSSNREIIKEVSCCRGSSPSSSPPSLSIRVRYVFLLRSREDDKRDATSETSWDSAGTIARALCNFASQLWGTRRVPGVVATRFLEETFDQSNDRTYRERDLIF